MMQESLSVGVTATPPNKALYDIWFVTHIAIPLMMLIE
jgi:hypothetical protein